MACGVFNLRIGGIADAAREGPRRLFALCTESLHINFLSAHVARQDVELFYVDPPELLRFALAELSPAVALHHGLVPGDVFLSVFRTLGSAPAK